MRNMREMMTLTEGMFSPASGKPGGLAAKIGGFFSPKENPELEKLKQKAKAESTHGYIRHVNSDPKLGAYISDEMPTEYTVASYKNGEEMISDLNEEHDDDFYIGWIKNAIEQIHPEDMPLEELRDRVAAETGYDANPRFDEFFKKAYSDFYALDMYSDEDEDDDYTDYSMRQGEMGNPERGMGEGARPGTYEVPAVQRKQQGQPPLTPQDVQRHDAEGRISHPDTLAKNVRNLPKEAAGQPPMEQIEQQVRQEMEQRVNAGMDPDEAAQEVYGLSDSHMWAVALGQVQAEYGASNFGSIEEKSKSQKQARFMAACAHGADYDSCPSDDVAKEFNKADTGTKQLSRAMKNRESIGMEEAHVDSCKQSNGAPARKACAMEGDEGEGESQQSEAVTDALANFENLVMNYYVEPEIAYDKIIETLTSQGHDESVIAEFNAALEQIADEERADAEKETFDLDEDINNGYYDRHFARGVDYFPSGADSSVVDRTGAAGARHGDNPEQKKMAVVETHKELVYKYRAFLKESASK